MFTLCDTNTGIRSLRLFASGMPVSCNARAYILQVTEHFKIIYNGKSKLYSSIQTTDYL
jgi:hypothetical protein